MEPFLADLINNNKVPKIIRYLIVILICGFIIFLGVFVGINSELLWGKIFGFVLAIVSLILGIILLRRISNN